MENFVGKFISVNCGDELGVFQGQIIHVDANTVTLDKAFCDGRPYHIQPVTIQSKTIKSLDLLNITPAQSLARTSSVRAVKVERPVPLRADAHQSPLKNQDSPRFVPPSPLKPDLAARGSLVDSCNGVLEARSSPRKVDMAASRRQRSRFRKDEAFGSPIDHTVYAEFDFEKNLALFDKKAVYDEINASKPDLVRHSDKKPSNYRCNENVLETETTRFCQIRVPEPDRMEYVTDSGLVVPSVASSMRAQVASFAEKTGLLFVRQADLLARGAVEIALHLLGGAHRLNPHNLHQCPSVAVLCGGHRAGIQAASCARQLASHGVRTFLYVSENADSANIATELSLAKLSGCRVFSNAEELCSLTVDLIILGLADAGQVARGPSSPATRWAHSHRAPILAIDPPPLGTAGLTAKCCVVPILPLSHDSSNGRVYLANVGIPRSVFRMAGIEYLPPFGPKLVIPLYPNDG